MLENVNGQGGFWVTITDLSGKEVLTRTHVFSHQFSLDISNRPNGTYLIRVEQAGSIQNFRLVKED
ncbi:T9SS type A sorting domain-containing protein [bacterium SCSIO 12741]|nr:T9SS type A sorting domain-containing protein [bacterium SCSIO 12741]